jgi:hypothetical protein
LRECDEAAVRHSYADLGGVGLHYVEAGDTVNWVRRALANSVRERTEVRIEVDAVIDAYPEHFIEKALAISAAAEHKRASLIDATAEVRRADREAQGAWSTVRTSRIRRWLDPSPEVHLSDLGSASSELAKSKGQAYPGGSREAWERFRVAGKGERVSNAEALRAIGGEAA